MTSLSDEFAGPTPQLAVADADAAIRFYRDAFGADELVRNNARDGRIMHCELLVFGGRLLVVDKFDGDEISAPTHLGGTTIRLHLYVDDVDAVYRRALASGADSVRAPAVEFWGDRYAIIRDPMGHMWSLATPVDDLTPGGQNLRAREWSFAQDEQP